MVAGGSWCGSLMILLVAAWLLSGSTPPVGLARVTGDGPGYKPQRQDGNETTNARSRATPDAHPTTVINSRYMAFEHVPRRVVGHRERVGELGEVKVAVVGDKPTAEIKSAV